MRGEDAAHADGVFLPKCRSLSMSSMSKVKIISVGLIADEPIRLEGYASIFDDRFQNDPEQVSFVLVPVIGNMEELLNHSGIEYMLIDLNSSSGGLDVLDVVRRARPALRLIVVGPGNDEELVMKAIIAGARAYLDLSAGPQTVRMALEAVVAGSIWAPRRVLSKLIDRLLAFPDSSLTNGNPQLTVREHQVLDLILMARSNREIANQLGIEERTVKAHVGSLMRKTGSENRIELSMRALNLSLTSRSTDSNYRDTSSEH
jgi:DNA-binding NarL/FixJ family response regulator